MVEDVHKIMARVTVNGEEVQILMYVRIMMITAMTIYLRFFASAALDLKYCHPQGRSKVSSSSRSSRDNSRESPSRSSYLHSHSSSSSSGSSNYYSLPRTSSSSTTYMTIPELDEPKHDFYLQKTRARDITKRRGAIKLIQRPT
jgi:hypothetical protein